MAVVTEFVQDGIRYLPSKTLAKACGISPQYLTSFCRDGLVTAVFHRGAWHVEEQSLHRFLAEQEKQREEYNRRLSEEAKRDVEERARKAAAEEEQRIEVARAATRSALRVRRRTIASNGLLGTVTFFAAAISGALAFQTIAPEKFADTLHAAAHAPESISSQLAAASSLPVVDVLASSLFKTFCPIFNDCPPATPVATQHLQQSQTQTFPTQQTACAALSSFRQRPEFDRARCSPGSRAWASTRR
jgi:hypothetical protein